MTEQSQKVHLWIGTNTTSEEKYLKYFELDYSTEGDLDDPNYTPCQFCKDVNIKWYDEDFIGIIPRHEKEVDIDTILEDAAVDLGEFEKIKKICFKLGIKKANAIFWYADSELNINQPYKDSYNGLKYIGVFIED